MNKVLRIYTGVYGILRKENKKGVMTDVYMDTPDSKQKTGAIEVPLAVWKLVIDVKTNDSVAFFTSNDSDMDEEEIAHFSTICPSVCDEFGYKFKAEPKSGITVCCRYKDFVRHIRYLPINLTKSNLLKNEARAPPKNRKLSIQRNGLGLISALQNLLIF